MIRRFIIVMCLILMGLNFWRFLVDGHSYNLVSGAACLAAVLLTRRSK